MTQNKIGILGAGAWGTAVAQALANLMYNKFIIMLNDFIIIRLNNFILLLT